MTPTNSGATDYNLLPPGERLLVWTACSCQQQRQQGDPAPQSLFASEL